MQKQAGFHRPVFVGALSINVVFFQVSALLHTLHLGNGTL
jgi:hypothetical protein